MCCVPGGHLLTARLDISIGYQSIVFEVWSFTETQERRYHLQIPWLETSVYMCSRNSCIRRPSLWKYSRAADQANPCCGRLGWAGLGWAQFLPLEPGQDDDSSSAHFREHLACMTLGPVLQKNPPDLQHPLNHWGRKCGSDFGKHPSTQPSGKSSTSTQQNTKFRDSGLRAEDG